MIKTVVTKERSCYILYFVVPLQKQNKVWEKKRDPTMSSWADLCEEEESPWIPVKATPKVKAPVVVEAGPLCYCGHPSTFDKVKKSGKREKIGTPFVACAKGVCKYWFTLPVPKDLPEVNCLCDRPAAACPVKNPESRHFGKYVSSCAFGKCKFYKVNSNPVEPMNPVDECE